MLSLNEYTQNIINFVKSIFIYFPDVAYTINKYNELHGDYKTIYDINQANPSEHRYLPTVNELNGIDDRANWKFYRNLAGLSYTGYIGGTDNINYFTSNSPIILNGQTITLNALKKSPNLLREFEYNYQYLLTKYPTDTLYLKGLKNPITFDELQNKKQGQIIYYDNSFIEYNETYLIYELQEYIYNVIDAWYNREYILVDNLYLTGFINTLYSMLPAKIMNLKISKIYSNEVDSFNLNNYFMDNYNNSLESLSDSTRIWLYWNTNLLKNKKGENYSIDLINNNILNPLGLILKRKVLYKSQLKPITNTNENLMYLPQFTTQPNIIENIPYNNDSNLVTIQQDTSNTVLNYNKQDTFNFSLTQVSEIYRILDFNELWNITLSYLAFQLYKNPTKLYYINNSILTGTGLIITLVNILYKSLNINKGFNFISYQYITLFLMNNPNLPDILIKKYNITSKKVITFLNYFKTAFLEPNANQLELSYLLVIYYKILRNNLTDAKFIRELNLLMDDIGVSSKSSLNILDNNNMEDGLNLNLQTSINGSLTPSQWMINLGLQNLMFLDITDLFNIINSTFNTNIEFLNFNKKYEDLVSILNKVIPYNIEIDLPIVEDSYNQVTNNLTNQLAHTDLRNINNIYVSNYTVYGLNETPVITTTFQEENYYNVNVINQSIPVIYT